MSNSERELLSQIHKSLEYNSLDYKWLAREYLGRNNDTISENLRVALRSIARSSFDYFKKHHDVITADPSLAAITTMCSDEELIFEINMPDTEVFHLSRIFNQIIESKRGLYKCYDCGTNARAMFLKLIKVHRGVGYITKEEQVRMKRNYVVNHSTVLDAVDRCHETLRSTESDAIFIMSVAIQDFGHVWVIEKRFIGGIPRYHHYQSSFKSHLVMDFIERKDYGQDPHQTLDLGAFFSDLKDIMAVKTAWEDRDYRLFCDLFAFHPVNPVNKPDPGFCFTYIVY